jgi:hydrogenase maturation protease
MTKIAVIGIGQSMRGDDAAGMEAVRQWSKKFPETAVRPEVEIEANELPGLALLDTLHEIDAAVLVDAVQSGAKPGTIHRLDETELASFVSDSKSAHGWGVAETIRMGRQLAEVNSVIRIIGIEAEQVEIGMGLSKSVQNAMPAICDAIEEEISCLLE